MKPGPKHNLPALTAGDAQAMRELRERLADARRRGASFDEAWLAAVNAVDWPQELKASYTWDQPLKETRDEWRRAYEREPTSNWAGRLAGWDAADDWDAPALSGVTLLT